MENDRAAKSCQRLHLIALPSLIVVQKKVPRGGMLTHRGEFRDISVSSRVSQLDPNACAVHLRGLLGVVCMYYTGYHSRGVWLLTCPAGRPIQIILLLPASLHCDIKVSCESRPITFSHLYDSFPLRSLPKLTCTTSLDLGTKWPPGIYITRHVSNSLYLFILVLVSKACHLVYQLSAILLPSQAQPYSRQSQHAPCCSRHQLPKLVLGGQTRRQKDCRQAQ